jgi:ABC-type multidrug transport system fused ATPase/permease subunit
MHSRASRSRQHGWRTAAKGDRRELCCEGCEVLRRDDSIGRRGRRESPVVHSASANAGMRSEACLGVQESAVTQLGTARPIGDDPFWGSGYKSTGYLPYTTVILWMRYLLLFALTIDPSRLRSQRNQIDGQRPKTKRLKKKDKMTSMAAESVSTILVSCKQTRFHIESPNYRELDIEGLNITVTSTSSSADSTTSTKAAKARGKTKAAEGTEILNDAKLRLKAGGRYALIGRNGSGKSSECLTYLTLIVGSRLGDISSHANGT